MGIPTDTVSNRILIFFSCWCLIALPIHYFTCAVERNSIPSFDSLSKQKVLFPVEINLFCISKSAEFCEELNDTVFQTIDEQFHNSIDYMKRFTLNIVYHKNDNLVPLENCKSSYTELSYLSCLQEIEPSQPGIGKYNFYLINSQNSEILSSWIVSPYRDAWINVNDNDNDKAKVLEGLYKVMDKMIYAQLESSKININVKDQIFSFTLLNSEPERGYNFEWNMKEIYNDYLQPFFNRISNILIYDYHIDSQILHYGYIISQPPTDDIHVDRADFTSILTNYIKRDEKKDYFYVTNIELQTFVGGTDWNRISSLINDVSPIQFMIYVPPKQYYPLHIKSNINGIISNDQYDAFLVPRFGGCIIYNPLLNDTNSKKRKIKIKTDKLYSTFNTVLSQLRLLLGLTNDYDNDDDDDNLLFIMDKSGINEWEIDILIREYILIDLETVELSLSNIYEMIEEVSQLPINKDVALLISDAIYAFDKALESCNDNNNYTLCIQWSRHSSYLVKKAEYHPSMLPALYFSPEFTYAVYSPYFLPGYIPIVAALFKKLKAKYKQYRNRA